MSSAADMVGVHEAAVLAARLPQEGLSAAGWAMLMGQCNRLLDGRDHAISRAAALGPLMVGTEGGTHPFSIELGNGRLDGSVTPGEHRLLRLVVLQATRAAWRGSDPLQRLVLAGVEREMLEAATGLGDVERALRGWTRAVSSLSGGPTPQEALAISATHRALLRRGEELLADRDVVDGVGLARLGAAVDASSAAWSRAHQTWRSMVRPAHDGDLVKAATALRLALWHGPDDETLTALIRTGFGGNLLSAMVVTPVEFRHAAELVHAAADLEPKSDVATTFNVATAAPMPVPPSAEAGTETLEVSRVVQSEPPSVAARSAVARWDLGLSDEVALGELARMRDAGVVARAALRGVEEAVALVKGASVDELQVLVDVGDQARAGIAEAGLPAVYFFSKRIFPRDRDDFVQSTVVALMGAAERWDPDRAQWSTYSSSVARFEMVRRMGRTSREFATETLGETSPRDPAAPGVFGSAPVLPEDVAVARVERAELARLVAQLPGALREAVVLRMGTMAGGRGTWSQIGSELEVSPTTASFRVERGLVTLRTLTDPARPASTEVSLQHLALALRHRPLPGAGAPIPERNHVDRTPTVTPSCV